VFRKETGSWWSPSRQHIRALADPNAHPSSSKRESIPSASFPSHLLSPTSNTNTKPNIFAAAQVSGRPPAQLAFWGPVRGLAAVSNPIMMHREPAAARSFLTHSRKHRVSQRTAKATMARSEAKRDLRLSAARRPQTTKLTMFGPHPMPLPIGGCQWPRFPLHVPGAAS
jgi:hypothetical protein